MDYFDIFDTEDEINEIEKSDNLYTEDVISLDDKKNRKYFNYYAYQQYLQNENKKEYKKAGGTNEED